MSEDEDYVPDPSMTIPFRRSASQEGATDRVEEATPGRTRRRAPARQLHLPSLILGFSAGVLATSAVCAFMFALFTLFI